MLKIIDAVKTLVSGLTCNTDGTFSSTKFWQGIGYATSTYIVVLYAQKGLLGAEFFLVYLGAITAARSFQNYLAQKTKKE